MEFFQKNKCIICGGKIKLSQENKKVCKRFCSFAYDKFCYLLPDGGVEYTRDMEHIKKKYAEKLEQERKRNLSTD